MILRLRGLRNTPLFRFAVSNRRIDLDLALHSKAVNEEQHIGAEKLITKRGSCENDAPHVLTQFTDELVDGNHVCLRHLHRVKQAAEEANGSQRNVFLSKDEVRLQNQPSMSDIVHETPQNAGNLQGKNAHCELLETMLHLFICIELGQTACRGVTKNRREQNVQVTHFGVNSEHAVFEASQRVADFANCFWGVRVDELDVSGEVVD